MVCVRIILATILGENSLVGKHLEKGRPVGRTVLEIRKVGRSNCCGDWGLEKKSGKNFFQLVRILVFCIFGVLYVCQSLSLVDFFLSSRLFMLCLTFIFIIRSYHPGYTGSHPNSEVKQDWAYLVLWWGTTRES